jgi:hypothetical protein
MPILGLVENMSGLVCPHCGERIDLFKRDGGLLTAKKENLPLLASLPIEPEVVELGDTGSLGKMTDSTRPFNQEFQKMADTVIRMTTTDAPGSFVHRYLEDDLITGANIEDHRQTFKTKGESDSSF